jgi:uncharacterized protein with NRDE domain
MIAGCVRMCLLALLNRVTEGAALVVGANREEAYSRGGLPPQFLEGVSAVGGVDPTHGGTWLGVNAQGVLVAVTNRPKSAVPTEPPSRGLLVRDLLRCPTAGLAVQQATERLQSASFAGCNLLCADESEAVLVHAGDWLRARPLPPGIHVLANSDVNDPTDRRVTHARYWLARRSLTRATEAVSALQELCGSHEPPEAPLCFRQAKRGTVSSSILVLRSPPGESEYLHAQGPPDTVPYADVSTLLKQLALSRSAP